MWYSFSLSQVKYIWLKILHSVNVGVTPGPKQKRGAVADY